MELMYILSLYAASLSRVHILTCTSGHCQAKGEGQIVFVALPLESLDLKRTQQIALQFASFSLVFSDVFLQPSSPILSQACISGYACI